MTTLTYEAIAPRVEAGLVEKRRERGSLAKDYFKAGACLAGIVSAVAVESFSFGVSLSAKFEVLSSGENIGGKLMPLVYSIGIVMLLAHILLHVATKASQTLGGRLQRLCHLLPPCILIGCMGCFMFLTTLDVTGSGDQLSLDGVALGFGCCVFFSISFLAANWLGEHCMTAIFTILEGRAKQAEIDEIKDELQEAVECRTNIETLTRGLAEYQQPDALIRKTAVEVAAIVAPHAAQANEAWETRVSLDGVEFGANDVVPACADLSISALEKRATHLKSLNYTHFLNVLKAES